jgi:pimeloyl-ACP methyl ester carboxylesterase
MTIIQRGSGVPLVFIPGLQGRWEYMRRAVEALAARCRVVTFSLADEPSSGRAFDPARGLENYIDQIDDALDTLQIASAAVCGISFGGRIAVRYALTRPERTSALILCSTPGPDWTPISTVRWSMRWPWLMAPWFFATAPGRLRPEIVQALPSVQERVAFTREQTSSLARYPLSPMRMARRARFMDGGRGDDCRTISAPTLVVTGEPSLDRIVPVSGSLKFAELIPDVRAVTMSSTGHLGCITRPREFAAVVTDFLMSRASTHAA